MDPRNSLGYLVKQSGRALRNRVQQNILSEGIGMTMEQGAILMNLWEEDGLLQTELSERLLKDKTTIARALDTMQENDLVVRVPDDKDKRSKRIYLTNKGKKVRDQFKIAILKTLEEATVGVSKKDQEITKKVLGKIFDNLAPNLDIK